LRNELMRQPVLVVGMVLICIGIAIAQDECPALVETALEQVDEFCEAAARNQACYGNVSLTVEPQADVTSFTFEQTGDIVDVSQIQSMTLAPMDEAANVWGVVLMRLQADIPDSLPGQNVTFLLFGDVKIENAVDTDDSDYTPMQAFYLETGIGDADCEEAPESGVLVQTPDGVEEVTFNVNGVDVEVGSTVLLQAEPESEMIISTVEGAAVMTMDGQRYPAVEGTRLRVPLGGDLRPSAPPGLPEAYGEANVRGLPVGLLPRPIEIPPPMPDGNLSTLHERLNNGEAPCGVEGLPECVHALHSESSEHPWAQGEKWGDQLPPRPENNPDNGLLPLSGEAGQSNLPRPGGGDATPPVPGGSPPLGNNLPMGNHRPGLPIGNALPTGNLSGGGGQLPVGGSPPGGQQPSSGNLTPGGNLPPLPGG
jgi:hypothetical protein